VFSFAGFPIGKVIGWACSERFCCVSFRLERATLASCWVGQLSKATPNTRSLPKDWNVIVSWAIMSTVPTSHPLGVYTGTRFFPVSTRSYAIKRLLRRSFHRARLHVELVSNRNAYPSRGQPLCCACDLYHASVSAGKASPSQSKACYKSHAHHTRLALRHGTTRQDVKASLY
jgi:hypothetical protein